MIKFSKKSGPDSKVCNAANKIPYQRKLNGAVLISVQGFLVPLYSNLSQI